MSAHTDKTPLGNSRRCIWVLPDGSVCNRPFNAMSDQQVVCPDHSEAQERKLAKERRVKNQKERRVLAKKNRRGGIVRYVIEPGVRFERLLVVSASAEKPYHWVCRCDCGAERPVRADSLTSGNSKSCGCIQREKIRDRGHRNATHGHTRQGHRSPEYRAWSHLMSRCYNPNVDHYPSYGGRGISVCAEWRESFEAFLADMGRRPSPLHSIDRKDNDGNYDPDNCHWATRAEQGLNKSTNRRLEFQGKRLTITEWAGIMGVTPRMISGRLKRGWSVEKTLTTPQLHVGKETNHAS